LLGVGVSTNVSAKVQVELTKSMPWVNSDRVSCRQISADGKIYGKCDQRLQLNPYGAGDDGKGGGYQIDKFYEVGVINANI